MFCRFKSITGDRGDYEEFTKFMETLLENGGRHKEYFLCMSVEYVYLFIIIARNVTVLFWKWIYTLFRYRQSKARAIVIKFLTQDIRFNNVGTSQLLVISFSVVFMITDNITFCTICNSFYFTRWQWRR